MKLNPGIVQTVKWLQQRGFRTVDSGDGEAHECDRPCAYVAILCEPSKLIAEADRLHRELANVGIAVASMNPFGGPMIQASYDPANQAAIIDLENVDDSYLREAISERTPRS